MFLATFSNYLLVNALRLKLNLICDQLLCCLTSLHDVMGYLQSSAVPKKIYADWSTQEGVEGWRKNKACFLFILIWRMRDGGNSYAKLTSAQHKLKTDRKVDYTNISNISCLKRDTQWKQNV
jgi:hypothetical protein